MPLNDEDGETLMERDGATTECVDEVQSIHTLSVWFYNKTTQCPHQTHVYHQNDLLYVVASTRCTIITTNKTQVFLYVGWIRLCWCTERRSTHFQTVVYVGDVVFGSRGAERPQTFLQFVVVNLGQAEVAHIGLKVHLWLAIFCPSG